MLRKESCPKRKTSERKNVKKIEFKCACFAASSTIIINQLVCYEDEVFVFISVAIDTLSYDS
jgi:hypothetical protein